LPSTQSPRRIALGVDSNGNESDLGAEVRAELILNKGLIGVRTGQVLVHKV
jgi:hypothetical protein